MNCQFEKSCSNYMVESIQRNGLIGGSIVGTDRIVRCNPAARTYHIHQPGAEIQYDGRLVDPVQWHSIPGHQKSPVLAVSLSVVPGLGRAYAGHPYDGIFSFLLVGGFAFNTWNQDRAGNNIRAAINGGLMLLFWSADIYGAYRTAHLSAPQVQNP